MLSIFKVTSLFDAKYLTNGYRYGQRNKNIFISYSILVTVQLFQYAFVRWRFSRALAQQWRRAMWKFC